MAIHQIQLRYDEAEDRLLLRLTTHDDCEYRFWLTRRLVKRLWRVLVQMLEWNQAVKQQVDPETKRAVLDLQHEAYAQGADYQTAFRDSVRKTPLGETPVLVAMGQGRKRADGVQLLSLYPSQGQGIDITMDGRLLHVFSRLVREQVAKTDWDLNLALYEGATADSAVAEAQPRRLN